MAPIQQCASPLLLLPPELRSMIYEYLLPPSFDNDMLIETWEAPSILTKCPPKGLRRTTYANYDRSKPYHAPAYLTTYRASRMHRDDNERMCPEIMAVNRQINYEASHFLYGTRCFHFRHHLNALSAFVEDLRPITKAMIQKVSLNLTLPGCPLKMLGSDDPDAWPKAAQALHEIPYLRGLAITLTGLAAPQGATLATPASVSRPTTTTTPKRPSPKPTVEIFQYLCFTGDESVSWILELLPLPSLEHLVILPKVLSDHRLTKGTISGKAHNYAQISAHMETTMIDFMMDQGLPARLPTMREKKVMNSNYSGIPHFSIRLVDFSR